jgi:hypothetical protein
VMPLKGILLHRLVYDHPGERSMADIDVLVPTEKFAAALEVVRALGYSVTKDPRSMHKAVLQRPHAPSTVDLHGQIFVRHTSGLTPEVMFAGAEVDERLYAAPVSVPTPEHLLIHALLHFAHHKFGGQDLPQREDIRRIASRFPIDRARFAALARDLRSSRACYYALAAARGGAGNDEVDRLARSLELPWALAAMLSWLAQTRIPQAGPLRLGVGMLLVDHAFDLIESMVDYATGYRRWRSR